MQHIINYIFRNSIRFLFLLLLTISLFLTVQSHSYHRSEFVNSANIVSGFFYQKGIDIKNYFNLESQNKRLHKENARLRKLLFNSNDKKTNLKIESFKNTYKYEVVSGQIIHNSFHLSENYLTINKGSNDGIKPNMAVISSNGIVGVVEKVSKNYATIFSILNVKSKINAKVKKTNHFGTLVWDAKNAGYVQLKEIPRLAKIRKKELVVTGGSSLIFPENIPIGYIDKIFVNSKNNYYTLNVRLFNDMTNLDYIYVIINKESKEVEQLEKETLKNE